jgi:hypothetical protein
MEPSQEGRSRDGEALGDGGDLEVLFVHALDPRLVEVVGIDGLPDLLNRLPQPRRFLLGRHAQEPALGHTDDLGADVAEPVPEQVQMLQPHPTGDRDLRDSGQGTHRRVGTHVLLGLVRLQPQMIPRPRHHRRGTVELVPPGLDQLPQQMSLRRIKSVLRRLHLDQCVPHITGSQSVRALAHRLDRDLGTHTPMILEQAFEHQAGIEISDWNSRDFRLCRES